MSGVVLERSCLLCSSSRASCGGDGDDAPRVTLTDKSCTYSGARTHEPGVFDIEAENTTSHLASFAVYELAPGFSIKDVRGFFQRVMVDNNVKPPTPDDFRRNEIWGHADPRATTLLPVNASAGRLVIVCMENFSADTRPSGDVWPAHGHLRACRARDSVGMAECRRRRRRRSFRRRR